MTITAQIIPMLPAAVEDGVGIDLSVTNAVLRADLDYEDVPDGGVVTDHPNYRIAAQDPDTGAFYSFPVYTGGAAPTSLDTIDVRDYGAVGDGRPEDTAFIQAAIDALGLGWRLFVPYGRWQFPENIVKSDWVLMGAGMPSMAANERSLQNGTILLGRTNIFGSRFRGYNFGVDAGADFLGAGPTTDALNVTSPGAEQITDIELINVCGLCKDSIAGVHGVLVQNVNRYKLDNIKGYLGAFGVVVKGTNGDSGSLWGYHNGVSCITYKSDDYAPAHTSRFTSLGGIGIASTETVVVFHAATASMFNCSVDKIYGSGGKRTFATISSPRPVDPMAPTPSEYPNCAMFGMNFGDIISNDATDDGVKTQGAINTSKIGKAIIRGTVTGRAFWIDSDTFGLDIDDIFASTPNFYAGAVTLQGLYSANQIITCVGDNRATKNGILLNPEFRGLCPVGLVYGVTSFDSGPAQIAAGWGYTAGITAPAFTFENNKVTMRGAITPPGGGPAGTNYIAFYPNCPPVRDTIMTFMGYKASGEIVPVTATLYAGGGLFFTGYFSGGPFTTDIVRVEFGNQSYDVK